MKDDLEPLYRIFERLEVLASDRTTDREYQKRRLVDVIVERIGELPENRRYLVWDNVGTIIEALAQREVFEHYLREVEARDWPVYMGGIKVSSRPKVHRSRG